MVWHVEVHADVFSKDFCEQLHLDRIEWPPVDQPFYYDLGIRVSSVNIYDTERIRQYLGSAEKVWKVEENAGKRA